jgi:predicted nucleic acid-binding protein
MSGNSARQFIDTNVLVYAHDVSAGAKHARAQNLLEELWVSHNGCLSIQVLQEFYVTVTRKVARPLPIAEAAQIITDLSVWKIHAPQAEDVLGAIEIQQRYGIAFWDAMVVRSASRLGCQTLWSEDLNSSRAYEGVTVVNPFAL